MRPQNPQSLINAISETVNKDTNLKPISVSPNFESLDSPEPFFTHLEELKSSTYNVPAHETLLKYLLKQCEPLNFQVLAFPKAKSLQDKLSRLSSDCDESKDIRKQLEKLKVTTKHYRILSVKHITETATKNNWGLCKRFDFIYLYNSTYWAEVDKDEFQKFLGEAAEAMGVNWDNAQDYIFREQLFKQFLATGHLSTPYSDENKVLINLLNGTFEISSKETKLRPFERQDFLTYQLPFEYNPEAQAPLFYQYLNRVLPDIECQRVLAEYLGFIFIKNGNKALKEEKALILYGTGANGKSVFFELVNALLGFENVSNYSLQSLTDNNGYYRAKIANKLVNYASEINSNLEASIFKQLVSGEPVEARLPYGQPFILKQYAKLIFNCNELPKDVEQTNAYFRRFLIIPFDVTIPPEEQDKTLHTKIIDNELSGVFNWVLEGLNRLLKQQSFSNCEAAKKVLDQYKLESDSVQMFLQDNNYTTSLTETIALKELYSQYKVYCSECNFKTCSLRTFSDRLKKSGYELNRKSYGMVAYAEIKSFN